MRNLGQFEGKGELGAWIRRIMVNTSINYLKKHVQYRMEMVFTEPAMHPVSEESPDLKIECQGTHCLAPATAHRVPGRLQPACGGRIQPRGDRPVAGNQ
ncbi:MAG: hypothetical protein MZV63_72420 [Marinilabiliales bacterium]|nr:hypothetical protein [Marinilabiliales bacterium]